MKNEIINATFDYSKLDDDTAAKLRYYAQSGHTLIRKSHMQFMADIGKILSDARKLLANHGDGTFCKWATLEFDITKKTVYNYVNSWDRCLCNGYTNVDNVTPTALYLLANDKTPKSVRDKVLKLASKQQTVTKADVQNYLPRGKGGSEDTEPIEVEMDGHESAVWQAQQVLKQRADAVGRWLSGPPSIDEYREQFPGKAGDRVLELTKELYNALNAWKKSVK